MPESKLKLGHVTEVELDSVLDYFHCEPSSEPPSSDLLYRMVSEIRWQARQVEIRDEPGWAQFCEEVKRDGDAT